MPNKSDAHYPSLKGRHVLVTGGASGIGAALVEDFCRQGSTVTFFDRDKQAAHERLAYLSATYGTSPHFIFCDVVDADGLKAAVLQSIEARGPVRVLVNNAANDDRHNWETVTPEYWDDRIAVNLKHQFFAIQVVAPAMAGAGGGSIINMSSISWKLGLGGMPCYVSAKSAIIGLTRSFARDLGSRNIRVNAVLPGWIMTPRQIKLYLTPEAEADLLKAQCIKRKLMPEDLTPIVMFLASDDSRACTNQTYIVDGGWT